MGRVARANRQPWINRLRVRVLSSPVSGLVDGRFALLTVHGRRTGRPITFPVQYAVGDDAIWAWAADPEAKTWWRNLRQPAAIELRLRGESVETTAAAVTPSSCPVVFERGRAAYVARFPRTAQRLAADDTDRVVLVRIEVPATVLERARQAVKPPGCGIAQNVRRHPLGAFVVVAFALSWGY